MAEKNKFEIARQRARQRATAASQDASEAIRRGSDVL